MRGLRRWPKPAQQFCDRPKIRDDPARAALPRVRLLHGRPAGTGDRLRFRKGAGEGEESVAVAGAPLVVPVSIDEHIKVSIGDCSKSLRPWAGTPLTPEQILSGVETPAAAQTLNTIADALRPDR